MAANGISGNWSSRHLVSCSARTSTSRRSSQAATRSARDRMELTFQVASRTLSSLRSPSRTVSALERLRSDLDGHLAAGGDAGPHPLPALDELGGLGVEPGQELRQLLAGL